MGRENRPIGFAVPESPRFRFRHKNKGAGHSRPTGNTDRGLVAHGRLVA